MNGYLSLKKSNCQNCSKCIRYCPVKSIRLSANQAQIVGSECILCGYCFVVCPQNAKEIRCDIPRVRRLIASGRPVYVSLAPSFVADFPGMTITAMRKALLQLGFAGVEETAQGASVVKNRYMEILEQERPPVLISSCCHSVNLLIRRHFPQVLPYLAPVRSPMQVHCVDIKRRHPDALTVFIGPCISKKAEADEYSDAVDCVLTFEDLWQWFNEEGVTLTAADDPPEAGGRARLFPAAGGILRSMQGKTPDYTYIVVDGPQNCVYALRDILHGDLKNCFIEMSACTGGCIGGPAMDKSRRAHLRDYARVDRSAPDRDFDLPMPDRSLLYAEHSLMGLRRQKPDRSAIEGVLHALGKLTPAQELNCGSCGYNTCREKAEAVLSGKADLTMCLPYLKEKAETFSENIMNNTPNGIFLLDKSLLIQQINTAACSILDIPRPEAAAGQFIGRYLCAEPFAQAMQTRRSSSAVRLELPRQQKYIELTVVYDGKYHNLLAILRDVTHETEAHARKEALNRHTIEITDKVIEKQMRVVQDIASLLGETTAETKIALTRLKESLRDE